MITDYVITNLVTSQLITSSITDLVTDFQIKYPSNLLLIQLLISTSSAYHWIKCQLKYYQLINHQSLGSQSNYQLIK